MYSVAEAYKFTLKTIAPLEGIEPSYHPPNVYNGIRLEDGCQEPEENNNVIDTNIHNCK